MRTRTWIALSAFVLLLVAEGGGLVMLKASNNRVQDDIRAATQDIANQREDETTAETELKQARESLKSAKQDRRALGAELRAVKASEGVPTIVELFEPFSANGELDAAIQTRQATGDCEFGSFADSGRPEAWRCFAAGSEIHDPCFENADRSLLACFDSPLQSSDVVLLHPSKPLQPTQANDGSPNDSAPWFIELTDGRQCFYMAGATFGVGELRANFSCDQGGIVFGDPDRSESLWTMAYAGGSTSEIIEDATSGRLTETTLERVPIAVAWY